MRKIQTTDLFNALRMIRKANLKEDIKPILKMAGSGDLKVEDVGISGILAFIEILSEKKCEQAIYEVLAPIFEVDVKDVAKMDLIELVENLQTLAKENDLKRFFTLLAGTV